MLRKVGGKSSLGNWNMLSSVQIKERIEPPDNFTYMNSKWTFKKFTHILLKISLIKIWVTLGWHCGSSGRVPSKHETLSSNPSTAHTYTYIHTYIHIYIHIYIILKHYSPLFTVLMFTLIIYKQLWLKLLAPYHESNQQCQMVPVVTDFFTATLRSNECIYIMYINTNIYIYIFVCVYIFVCMTTKRRKNSIAF
jgi:hypothetical protein